MTLHVVKFAIRGREPEVILISGDEHDRWCECEPPEGYAVFETFATFEIESITIDCLQALTRLYLDDVEPGWRSLGSR